MVCHGLVLIMHYPISLSSIGIFFPDQNRQVLKQPVLFHAYDGKAKYNFHFIQALSIKFLSLFPFYIINLFNITKKTHEKLKINYSSSFDAVFYNECYCTKKDTETAAASLIKIASIPLILEQEPLFQRKIINNSLI